MFQGKCEHEHQIREGWGLSPFTAMTNIFVTEFAEFSKKIEEKLQCCLSMLTSHNEEAIFVMIVCESMLCLLSNGKISLRYNYVHRTENKIIRSGQPIVLLCSFSYVMSLFFGFPYYLSLFGDHMSFYLHKKLACVNQVILKYLHGV